MLLQTPAGGQGMARPPGSRWSLVVSNGPALKMPQLVDANCKAAADALRGMQLGPQRQRAGAVLAGADREGAERQGRRPAHRRDSGSTCAAGRVSGRTSRPPAGWPRRRCPTWTRPRPRWSRSSSPTRAAGRSPTATRPRTRRSWPACAERVGARLHPRVAAGQPRLADRRPRWTARPRRSPTRLRRGARDRRPRRWCSTPARRSTTGTPPTALRQVRQVLLPLLDAGRRRRRPAAAGRAERRRRPQPRGPGRAARPTTSTRSTATRGSASASTPATRGPPGTTWPRRAA